MKYWPLRNPFLKREIAAYVASQVYFESMKNTRTRIALKWVKLQLLTWFFVKQRRELVKQRVLDQSKQHYPSMMLTVIEQIDKSVSRVRDILAQVLDLSYFHQVDIQLLVNFVIDLTEAVVEQAKDKVFESSDAEKAFICQVAICLVETKYTSLRYLIKDISNVIQVCRIEKLVRCRQQLLVLICHKTNKAENIQGSGPRNSLSIV